MVLPELDDVSRVVLERHDGVVNAVARDQEHAGRDRRHEPIRRPGRLLRGCRIVGKAELGLVQLPIVRAAPALMRQRESARPRADIAHGVVEVEHAGAIPMQACPGVDGESAA